MPIRSIYAIIPYYTSLGENATRIHYADGTVVCVPTPIRTFLRRLLYDAHLDPRALQHWTLEMTGAKLNTPLVLNEELIFIPIKMRHAIGKSDGCFGYVLASQITTFADSTLTLANTTKLHTLSSKSFVIKKLRDARLLRYAYIEHRKPYDF